MSPRPLAGDRLRRVLAVVPYVAEHPGVHLDELATRYGVARRELERDLQLLWFCGLPPYTADRLIDVEIVDGHVRVRFAEYFARPFRLTPAEGLGLLAAARALLDLPGSDPDGALASATAKLAAALGEGGRLSVELGPGAALEPLRLAAEQHAPVEIDYYSAGRDASTTRVIEPGEIFYEGGRWYADAYCHLAEAERLFRVDRVRAVRPADAALASEARPGRIARPADEGAAVANSRRVFQPDRDDTRVRLRLAPDAAWVLESYPTEEVRRERDGSLSVLLAVSGEAWLERLLLRLGSAAEVQEPTALRGVGPSAAERVLARYRSGA